MFVDDEKAIRDNLSSLVSLEDEGFQIVGTAVNGLDALQKIPNLKPNVIFLDVSMPVMDGLTFLKELKKSKYAKIEIVILSGYNEFEYAKMAMRYGARAYLSKPVDEDEMMVILRELKENIQNRMQLTGSKMTVTSELIAKVEQVKKWYRGGVITNQEFENYFIMHLVVLSEAGKDNISSDLLKDLLSDTSELSSYGLIRSRGCVYSYLVNRQIVLNSYHNDFNGYINGMILRLRSFKKTCAVLIDVNSLSIQDRPFRNLYDSNLYEMMTELFYHSELMSFINALNDGQKVHQTSDKRKLLHPLQEEKCLVNIRDGLENLNWNTIQDSMEQLFQEIRQYRISIEYVQEIRYRLYYLMIDLYPDIKWNKCDFWEQTYFNRFPEWKRSVMEWLEEIYQACKEKVKEKYLAGRMEIVAWVKRHYKEPITLKQAADHFYLNTAYFGRVFQKMAGCSFNQYVNELRLEEGKRLLDQTDKMIYEIADEIGYTESKYFISKFTEKNGLSPSEYRKNHGINRPL